MPSKPSGAKFAISKPEEYCEAAPSTWLLAYHPVRLRIGQTRQNGLTTKPAIPTVSLYCSPRTVEPSPYARLNALFRSTAEELALGLYNVWPSHVDPQFDAGRKRSAEPVSKSTELR